MSRTFLMQDWVTIRGASSLTSLVQDEERWLDLAGFSDVTCWIDVAEITPPAGSSSNWLVLGLETAAVCDETYFTPAAPPVSLGISTSPFNLASPTPLVVRSARSASTSSLSRYLRWKITPSVSGAWDLTFRIRAVATRTSAFSPLDLSGCQLWFRGDMGLTFNGTAVSQWNDQSGNGRNLTQATAALQPTYVPVSSLNNMPALNFVQASKHVMSTANATFSGPATILTVVSPTGSTWGYSRIFETLWSNGYFLGAGNTTAWTTIINGTFGSTGGSTAAGNVIVSMNFDGTTGTVYQNGTSVASNAFTAPTGASNPNSVGGLPGSANTTDYFNGLIAEVLFYNRALTPAELRRMHRYLGARYNITVP